MAEPQISILPAALRCRCPRCGTGKLFKGLLTLQPVCPACGPDLGRSDTGDAEAVGVIMVLCALVLGMAFWVEFHLAPPLWVHTIVWPVVTVPLAVLIMRQVKAALVATQFRHRPNEMGL